MKSAGPARAGVVVAGVVLLGLVALAPGQPPIRIGASVSQTGPYGALGQNQLRGYQLCIKHANEKGGVLGRRLELMVEDDRSEPLFDSYPPRTTDFSAILGRIRSANPDVLAAATYFDDAVTIARQMKELDVAPRMFGVTAGGDLPKFYELLGRTTEFVYGATRWEPELMMLVREGQLIPVSRRYPEAREFVEAHRKEFPGADLSYHTACGYSGCQVLLEAIKRAGALDGEKLRAAILKLDLNTVYGPFRVDAEGIQVAHGMLTFQWQDGRKVIVWPDELAPGKPRFPTPPWSQRQ